MPIPDEIRERVLEAVNLELYRNGKLHGRQIATVTDTVLAVLDRDALIAMLGAEQVGWWRHGYAYLEPRDATPSQREGWEPVYRFTAQEDRPQ